MNLYSYKGSEPKKLPQRLRLESGLTVTSLDELSEEVLFDLGFIGPIIKPIIDEETQEIFWNGSEYIIEDLSQEQILSKKIRTSTIYYSEFWDRLSLGNFYKKLRLVSSQSLQANTLCTELIAIFSEAKNGVVNKHKIQNYINIILCI